MILQKTWERYFYKEFLKVFFLFIFCFYGLYILIDYASHTSAILQNKASFSWIKLLKFYTFVFLIRAEMLIPLAILLATIKTLTTFNVRYELVALMCAGIRKRALLRPFLIICSLFVFLMYVNEELAIPKALKNIKYMEDSGEFQKNRRKAEVMIQNISLEDGSTILYQNFDSALNQFWDVFWIRSPDDIYRIKSLQPYWKIPLGIHVEHFARDNEGVLKETELFEQLEFPEMHLNAKALSDTITPPEGFSIQTLVQKIANTQKDLTEKESQYLTMFYWKLMIPWLSLFAFISAAPFCIEFNRTLPVFLIYMLGVFGLLAFYILLDAAAVLGKRQVMHPIGLFFPFTLAFGTAYYRFLRVT